MWLSFLAGIGRWLLRRWKPVLIAVAAAAVIASVFLYVRGAENAKGRLLVMEQRLAAAEAASAQNSAEVEKCIALNQANAREAQLQADRARAAAEKVRALQAVEKYLMSLIAQREINRLGRVVVLGGVA